jgi:hypothetical protein
VENNHLFQEADPPEEWANDTASEGFIITSPLVRLARSRSSCTFQKVAADPRFLSPLAQPHQRFDRRCRASGAMPPFYA